MSYFVYFSFLAMYLTISGNIAHSSNKFNVQSVRALDLFYVLIYTNIITNDYNDFYC